MALEVRLNLGFGLLLARGGRYAFHHARAGQSPNGFFQRELAPLANLPLQLGIRLRTTLGLVSPCVALAVESLWPARRVQRICTTCETYDCRQANYGEVLVF